MSGAGGTFGVRQRVARAVNDDGRSQSIQLLRSVAIHHIRCGGDTWRDRENY